MDVIFTIVSRNYGAQAATLMQSLAAAEPEARRVVVASDGPNPQLAALAEVIEAAELGAPIRDMSVYYDALELNTAIKPYAFHRLLSEPGVTSVTYLDPDIFVYRPLTAVREGLREAQLCLTPHTTRPLLGAALPNDQDLLRSGAYNLGFVSGRRDPKVFALLDWWAERCRFDCRVDLANGLFTDQKWMDLAPGFVDSFALLRDPGLNLAYWNLEGRTLERAADGWRVDGEPLTFFHFSGFDPTRPKVLSKHQNRLSVEPGSPLAELLAEFGQVMLRNGHASASAIAYAYARFPSGRAVTGTMRRRALRAAREGESFPAGLGEATSVWFDEPDPEATAPGLPDITRLMDQAWRESPAADHFARTTAEGRLGFHQWFADNVEALGGDAEAVRAARQLVQTGGGSRDPAPGLWRDTPWPGPASQVAAWLREPTEGTPRACLALLTARRDLRQRFENQPQALLAWCLGPEAAAGRFAVDLLPDPVIAALAQDAAPLFQAARFAEYAPGPNDLRRRLAAGFGVGERAGWPDVLTDLLRAPHLAPVEHLPPPFVRLFLDIWEARADLQRLYPLHAAMGRLRYLRWLIAGGLAEYGVEYSALPARVRNHPMTRLAELSVRHLRNAAPARSMARAAQLWVVEGADAATPPGALVFEAATGRFRDAAGAVSPPPASVDQLWFLTEPGLVPADAVALHARGVSWGKAAGVWDTAAVGRLTKDDLALGFVDEVWTPVPVARGDLPRPVRTLDAASALHGAFAAALAA